MASKKTNFRALDNAYLVEFDASIVSQFNASGATVKRIEELGLKPDDTAKIKILHDRFTPTWVGLCFIKAGLAKGDDKDALNKLVEACLDTPKSKRTPVQTRAYNSAKVAWMDIKERSGLKAPPKKREVDAKASNEEEETEATSVIEAARIPALISPDDLALFMLNLADFIDRTRSQNAKIKGDGMLSALTDATQALRAAVATYEAANKK